MRFVFVNLLLLIITSCNTKQRNTDKHQVFRLNLSSGSLESLDPAFAKDLYTMWTAHMLYNTLVETDSNLHIQPSLAKSWEISNDGLCYTFHLRTDVYFHENKLLKSKRKMTAHDVVYSFSRIVDAKVASSGAWIFNGHIKDFTAFVAKDDSTFILRLTKTFRPMLAMLSMPYCSIVPKEVVNHFGKDFRTNPCGTGPFQINVWDEGNVLILNRNNRYWEHDNNKRQLPYLDALYITFNDNKATEFLLFLQKKIDFTHGLDGSFKDLILRKDGTLKENYKKQFNLNVRPYLNTEYLGFLTDTNSPLLNSSPLKNKLVRQAINYAIDRKKIITYFKNGIGYPATGGFTALGLEGFDTIAHYGYNYNPQKAIQLLSDAGFPKGKGLKPFSISCPENYADIVNFVCTQLQEIGIPAKVEIVHPNILKQQMSRSQVLFFRAQWIADYPDAETYLAFFNSNFPAPPNYTRYNNPEFDLLYQNSISLPDSLRLIAYRKMDSMAISDAPLVPLYYDQMLHFTQLYVDGLSSNPMNLIELKRVSIKRKN